MVGESNQNVFLIQKVASRFAEFELSEFDISRFDCNFVGQVTAKTEFMFGLIGIGG